MTPAIILSTASAVVSGVAIVIAGRSLRSARNWQRKAHSAEATIDRERAQAGRELHAKDAVIAMKNSEIVKLITQIRRMSER